MSDNTRNNIESVEYKPENIEQVEELLSRCKYDIVCEKDMIQLDGTLPMVIPHFGIQNVVEEGDMLYLCDEDEIRFVIKDMPMNGQRAHLYFPKVIE